MPEETSEIAELISAIVLDPEITEIAVADTAVLIAGLKSGRLEGLSIARAEAWRQLRARNVFPYDERLVQANADPVAALTGIERTVLALVGRVGLDFSEAAQVCAMTPKRFKKTFYRAKIQLVRAATAIALLSTESRCPAVVSGKRRFGTAVDRKKAMHFVVHAGECSICVPVLRAVDQRIWLDYQNAPREAIAVGKSNLDFATLLQRTEIKAGFALPISADFRDQYRTLNRAAVVAGFSSVLLLIAWLLR